MVHGHGYLVDLSSDERGRANHARTQPERLARNLGDGPARRATVPPLPENAGVSRGYSPADMRQRGCFG